jgi:hypothetical protein
MMRLANAMPDNPPQHTARELDAILRSKIESLLNSAGVWNLHSYGWADAYNADPKFIGHAMWQTDPPFDHDHLWSIGRRHRVQSQRPQPTQQQKLLSVSGADFDGLMDAARMSIGLLLLQADAMREFALHDDIFFDLHHMSAVIYFATASERIRDFFIAAAFRISQTEYQNGLFRDQKRSWYVTPFLEARERFSESSLGLTEPLTKACTLAEQIRALRDTRNELIHELATVIGRRERELFRHGLDVAEIEDLKFQDLQKIRKQAERATERRISETTKQLAAWYELLAQSAMRFL